MLAAPALVAREGRARAVSSGWELLVASHAKLSFLCWHLCHKACRMAIVALHCVALRLQHRIYPVVPLDVAVMASMYPSGIEHLLHQLTHLQRGLTDVLCQLTVLQHEQQQQASMLITTQTRQQDLLVAQHGQMMVLVQWETSLRDQYFKFKNQAEQQQHRVIQKQDKMIEQQHKLFEQQQTHLKLLQQHLEQMQMQRMQEHVQPEQMHRMHVQPEQMHRMPEQVQPEQMHRMQVERLMPVEELLRRLEDQDEDGDEDGDESDDETSWKADEPLQNPAGPTREVRRDQNEDRSTRPRKK